MKTLTLQSQCSSDSTVISNIFFDEYMPDANGEFVKIYLYLLRSSGDMNISISLLADKFNHTENDVMRALKYWAKTGLLLLSFEDSGLAGAKKELSGITLVSPLSLKKESSADANEIVSNPSDTCPVSFYNDYTVQNIPNLQGPKHSDSPASAATPSVVIEAAVKYPPKPAYTTSQLKKFSEKEELSQLLYIAQKYLGKTLTPTETNSIIYFYELLEFPSDLIEYLIEHCVSKECKSMRYIEKVALSWAEAGIRTVSAAKEESCAHSKKTYSVMKAFGISGRDPGKREREYITKWNDSYGFDTDIIIEACNRTLLKTHQPSFEYADSILTKWKEQNIRHLNELKELDEQFMKSQTSKRMSVAVKSTSNKFNNFDQREYDYDELEKQLLGSNK